MPGAELIFATERFDVRPWRLDDHDVAGCFGIYSSPEVATWLAMEPHPDLERSRSGLEQRMTRIDANPGFGWWPIIDRDRGIQADGSDIVGMIGLGPLADRDDIEVGWHVRHDRWTQGIATECARAALQLGFEERGLERIISITLPDNAASRRVMEKIGLTQIEDTDYKGLHHVQYAITSGTWFDRYGAVDHDEPPHHGGWDGEHEAPSLM